MRLNEYKLVNYALYFALGCLVLLNIEAAYRIRTIDKELERLNEYSVFDPDYARTMCLENLRYAYTSGCYRGTSYSGEFNVLLIDYCNNGFIEKQQYFEEQSISSTRRDRGSCL